MVQAFFTVVARAELFLTRLLQEDMEVQLIYAPDGKVIFMECGSDFVELMFDIMKAPLSSLCPMMRGDDEHPLMSMRKSMLGFGKQSFINDECVNTLPEPIDISKIVEANGDFDPQLPEGYRRTNQPDQPLVLQCVSCNYAFYPNQCPNYVLQCPSCCAGKKMHDYRLQPKLKNNAKFMVMDSLNIVEASSVKTLELIKSKVDTVGEVNLSSCTVTEECVKKLILRSLLGSKTILSDVFGDSGAAKGESAEGESISSFELFGGQESQS